MKKQVIIIGVLFVLFFLTLKITNYAVEVDVKAETPDYAGGAVIEITSSDTIKTLKLYKKASNEKFILFFVGNTNAKTFKYRIPNSKLSKEHETEIKVVVETETGDRGTGSTTIEKIKPRVSINPEETAKPSWSPSPIPTKPTPTTTASVSPGTSTEPSEEPSEEPSAEPSQEPEPDPEPSPSQSSTPGEPLPDAPGTTTQNDGNFNYIQVIPDNPEENMPLIIFLHGSGERGSVSGVQNLPITTYVSSKKAFEAGKFIFIAPVLNSGNWADAGNAEKAKELIEKVANQFKVNKSRIVLTGMSNGGHGTWYMANKYPNYFAAIVPMSGYSSIDANNLKNTPIWAISGDTGSMEIQFMSQMTNLVNAIKASGNTNAKMEVINGASHETIQQSYKRLELFQWMLGQSNGRTEEPGPGEETPIDTTPGLTKQKYKEMNYFQMIPDNPTQNLPLIVFLHGDGETKNFNSVGSLPITKYVSSKEAFNAGKFIFIAPHQNKYDWTGSGTVTTLMELIEKVANDFKCDKNRIILTGMSRGGIGTWYIANKHPNYFAAIVPMSGYYKGIDVNNFTSLPIWAISGTKGSNEQTYKKNMTELVNKINNASGRNLAKMEVIQGASHSTIQQQYKRQELFKWMLQQKKN